MQSLNDIRRTLPSDVKLVCVSKYQTVDAIQEAYDAGVKDFAESRVQELLKKREQLPRDIRWHFIGHLQTNKVRQIIPFIHLIQSVDSVHLLECINREAEKAERTIDVLLEVHVAQEDTKTGFSEADFEMLQTLVQTPLTNVRIVGVMAMASHTEEESRIRADFSKAATLYNQLFPNGGTLSMGMSDDYPIAIAAGANMVRIGSKIFMS